MIPTRAAAFLKLLADLKSPFGRRMVVLEGPRVERRQLAHEIASRLGWQIQQATAGSTLRRTTQNAPVAAGEKRSILFFDEADSLMGKRTTVQDAHDRYSNLGSGFGGLVVIGVDHSHQLPPPVTQRAKVIRVSDHWPPG